jgi:hypothetical protein
VGKIHPKYRVEIVITAFKYRHQFIKEHFHSFYTLLWTHRHHFKTLFVFLMVSTSIDSPFLHSIEWILIWDLLTRYRFKNKWKIGHGHGNVKMIASYYEHLETNKLFFRAKGGFKSRRKNNKIVKQKSNTTFVVLRVFKFGIQNKFRTK